MAAVSLPQLVVLMVAASVAAPGTAVVVATALPITEVVQLLKGMQRDLEGEAKEDADTYERLRCWCETNEKDKREAIEEQRQRIDQLEADIQAFSGTKGELGTNLERIKRDISEGKRALADATALRQREAAEFHEQEKQLIESIQLLRGAIEVLSKHHPAMLQDGSGDAAALDAMLPALRHAVHQNLPLLGWLQSSREKEVLLAFLNADSGILEPDVDDGAAVPQSLLQRSTRARRASLPYRSYAPQSGQVFGVLKQMKEAFEADLPEIQKEEISKQQAFSDLKGAKESEIAQLETEQKTKAAALADAKEGLFDASNELKDTKETLSADQRFLRELTERCTAGDFEWERRRKLRTEEIEAVSQAIAILTTDEVKDGQQTTWGLLQTSSQKVVTAGRRLGADSRRARSVALLEGLPVQSPDLVALLAAAKTDPFDKVLKAIDDLVAKLRVQQADEVKHRDFCIEEFHQNQAQTERKSAELSGLEARIEELKAGHKTLSDAIASLKRQIAQLQTELQGASEDRQRENHEFQRTVADQIRTIEALKAAYTRLAEFYLKHQTFVQEASVTGEEPKASSWRGLIPETTTIAPSPEFKDYASHRSSNHVLNLIQKLEGEAKVLMDDSSHDEQSAQTAYEALIVETNESVKAKSKLTVDKTEELAEVDEETAHRRVDRDQAVADLEALAETKAALSSQCDFLLKNFDARQEARAAEIDAMGQAKAILGGMRSL